MSKEAMRKILVILVLLALAAIPVLADTLYLKNGSVLKGTFVGFENGEFIFQLGNGNRLKFRATEVSRVVIDTERRDPRDDDYPRRDPIPSPPLPSTSGGGGGRLESQPPFDVRLEDQWIRSQIRVTNGQRIRVEATGTVVLEGQTQVSPDGLRDRRDPGSPLPDQNDGGLIATVGKDDDSPVIFIGRTREFIPDRDGVLYFTVNHGEARDARGAFRVLVSLDRGPGDRGPVGSSDGGPVNPGPAQAREKTVLVSANQPWTDTGIDLGPNMSVEIVAEGQIDIGGNRRSGPDGNRNANVSTSIYPIQNEGAGALIGKIRYRDGRDSNYVFVGSRGTPATEPNESGRFFLGINDDFYRDNSGAYRVIIRW